MPPLYIVEQGAKLRVEKRRLLVTRDGETIARVPFAHTNAVIIFGNTAITTPAMKRLMSGGIDVVFLTIYGSYEGRLVGAPSSYGALRQAQYERLKTEPDRLPLAQAIVRAKCANMRTLLQRRLPTYPAASVSDGIARLATLRERAARTTRLNSLRGVEGAASAAYFEGLRACIAPEWRFGVRSRRPPADPVNVLLSFGYTLLTRWLEASVNIVGLDPYIGILHRTEYGRPSLALDMAEEFRAVVVDSVVTRCINTGTITPASFTESDTGKYPVILSDGGRRAFIRAFEARLEEQITHPVTAEQVTYRRAFELQVRLLARALRDPAVPYRPFEVR